MSERKEDQKMKRTLTLLLALCTALSCFACSNNSEDVISDYNEEKSEKNDLKTPDVGNDIDPGEIVNSGICIDEADFKLEITNAYIDSDNNLKVDYVVQNKSDDKVYTMKGYESHVNGIYLESYFYNEINPDQIIENYGFVWGGKNYKYGLFDYSKTELFFEVTDESSKEIAYRGNITLYPLGKNLAESFEKSSEHLTDVICENDYVKAYVLGSEVTENDEATTWLGYIFFEKKVKDHISVYFNGDAYLNDMEVENLASLNFSNVFPENSMGGIMELRLDSQSFYYKDFSTLEFEWKFVGGAEKFVNLDITPVKYNFK